MKDITIIGAGIAGLTAAVYLKRSGYQVQILESNTYPGGRIATTEKDGYLLDHGFQVFLPMYPEAKRLLDYDRLDLKYFLPGALLLHSDGSQSLFADPIRNPTGAPMNIGIMLRMISALFSNKISFSDKWKLFQLSNRLKKKSIDDIFQQTSKTTMAVLEEEYGFQKSTIDNFLRPFFAGIFLEKELTTDRRMFDFIFKMFAEGLAAVPNQGMSMIPKQLAAEIGLENFHFGETVREINGGKAICESGKIVEGKFILLATEANGLVKNYFHKTNSKYQSTTHLHYIADQLPFSDKVIALISKPNGLLNNLCVINSIAPGYAKGGKHLISLSIIGANEFPERDLDKKVKSELKTWFGTEVLDWQLLDKKIIAYALPNQNNVINHLETTTIQLSDHLYMCGDHLLNGSVNAAMKSGRIAAETISKKLN